MGMPSLYCNQVSINSLLWYLMRERQTGMTTSSLQNSSRKKYEYRRNNIVHTHEVRRIWRQAHIEDFEYVGAGCWKRVHVRIFNGKSAVMTVDEAAVGISLVEMKA